MSINVFIIGRKWPMITGGGFGLGMAYSNCERDINASLSHKYEQKEKK